MIKMYTQDDIVRYIYGETSAEESLKIENQLFQDPELLSFYFEMLEFLPSLDKAMKNPSDKSIASILAYSAEKENNSADFIHYSVYRS